MNIKAQVNPYIIVGIIIFLALVVPIIETTNIYLTLNQNDQIGDALTFDIGKSPISAKILPNSQTATPYYIQIYDVNNNEIYKGFISQGVNNRISIYQNLNGQQLKIVLSVNINNLGWTKSQEKIINLSSVPK